MTTPAQPTGPTLTIVTDKPTYNVGDLLTLTATYADSASQPVQLTITATGTDAQNNTVSATSVVTVTQQTTQAMTVTASDNFQNTYAISSNDGKGTAVLTTTIGTPPAQAAPSA